MADLTLSCDGACYRADKDHVEKYPGENVVIAAPAGTTITWDSGTPVSPPLSKTVYASGRTSWAVWSRAEKGSYHFTPTGMGCDQRCAGSGKPSMNIL